jgi:hypothetical protein
VGWNTTLLLRVSNTSSPSQYLIDGWLKSDGAGLGGMIVAVSVSGSCVGAPFTNGSGYFSCTRDFSLGGAYNSTSATETATYTITASYDGGQPLSATAYANTLEGTSYAQCTTIQHGHKPSSNSTILTVTPQSTQATTLTKTPEQMQQDAKNEGLQLWGPDSFCPWPPFFKLHAKVTLDSSGANVQTWAGLFGCGLDSYDGLTAPLQKGLVGMDTTQIAVATGMMTSVAASVIGLYMLNFIATTISQLSLGVSLGLILPLYLGAGIAIIAGTNFIPDRTISRAALFGIGFALLTLCVVGFVSWSFAGAFPTILKQQLTGSDPAITAARYLVTAILCTSLTASYVLAANILFEDPLMWPFAVATFILAVLAIYLGSIR